jgi:DnaJ-class molecular chaperone
LKKAYTRKALECHLEKYSDDPNATEKFQQLNEAWPILKDPEKQRIYDQRGAEGLRESSNGDIGDFLSHLFGFSRGGAHPRHRTRDILRNLSVTLDELFNGAEKLVISSRRIPCSECHTIGCKAGFKPHQCEKCGGQGRVLAVQEIGSR